MRVALLSDIHGNRPLAHTTADNKRWLAGLSFRLDIRPLGGHEAGPTIRLVHGNQSLNTVYVTEERSDEFLAKMGEAI